MPDNREPIDAGAFIGKPAPANTSLKAQLNKFLNK
jgi:hypothetical protein